MPQWAALAKVRCPAMFVTGAQSDMISPETVEKMLAAVPGSVAEKIEHAGHLVAGDNPAQFNAAVSRFLDRVLGP
jgi:pimeloyl-ACP methyl ester carboxylesterase